MSPDGKQFYQRSDGAVSYDLTVLGVAQELKRGRNQEPPARPEGDEPGQESVSSAAHPERNLEEVDALKGALLVIQISQTFVFTVGFLLI